VRGELLALTGKVSDAVVTLTSGLNAFRSNNVTIFVPDALLRLAIAYAELGQFVDAWSSINEAIQMIETTGQKLFEAEVHRIAGEIALMSPARDAANAQAHFERALGIARQQQAKSWELRAAMSMARLWRERR
jgi:predicted ATPase